MQQLQLATYILNLKSRPDRKRMILERLPNGLVPEFTSDWNFDLDWKRIDPNLLSQFKIFPWKIRSDNTWWNRPLKKGEVACAIAHWECWHRASKREEGRFLFLEDDVSFAPGFAGKLETALNRLDNFDPGWHLLYLGREALDRDETAREGLLKPGYCYGAYAYILTKEGTEKVLNAGFERAIIPVDEFLPAMFIDHPREDVRRTFPRRLKAYAVEPDIVLSPDQSMWGSDTENSDFIE